REGASVERKRKKQRRRRDWRESINPRKHSEVADGVARQSEGSAQLSFLCAVRQGVPQGCPGIRLRMLQSQWRSGGRGQPNVRATPKGRKRAMVGRNGGRGEEAKLSTTSRPAGVHTQTGRETAAVRSAGYS